jgi:hypothetical protein
MIMQRVKREKTQVEQDLHAKFSEKCRVLDEDSKKNTISSNPVAGNSD